ncbi:MAG: glycosyltransferase [Methanofastidiosum sp.]
MTKKKIRVLFVASWYPTKENPVSGIFIERQAIAVSKYCDVAVLHVNLCNENEINISHDKGFLEVIVNKKKKSKLLNLIYYFIGHFQGYKIIKKQFGNFDLLHLHVIYPAGIFIFLLNLFSKKPYIISEHSTAYLDKNGIFARYGIFKKSFIRLIASNAKAIITVSNFLKESLEKNNITGKFYIIPNIVELDNNNSIKRNSNRKKILHISLLRDSHKNVSGIIEAIKELDSRRQDFKLDIVGDGPGRNSLEKISRDFGLLDRKIIFYGRVANIHNYLASCDFLVVNSNFETFCVVAAEALACGKPVISTRCGGPEEFIDESNGILIDIGDKKALVSAIEYMLDNHDKYDAKQIRERAKNNFSSEMVSKKIIQIYKEILNGFN